MAEARETNDYANWESITLQYYDQPVPEFVLSRAIEIKKMFPSAELKVEYLETRKPDPFLVLVVDGRKVYLEVWDEPKFEGRRTV